MGMMLLPEVEEFFSGVRGRECWSIIGGAGTGSIISLRFGEKIRRKQPVRNPTLSFEERIFEGERSLLVYCDWRLEAESAILGSSQSATENGELNLGPFVDVKNRIVSEIGFTSRWHDLRVEFDNGRVLSVFCDLPPDEDSDSNYVMFNPTTCIAATPRGSLEVEKLQKGGSCR